MAANSNNYHEHNLKTNLSTIRLHIGDKFFFHALLPNKTSPLTPIFHQEQGHQETAYKPLFIGNHY
jgi:hypothetical protein